MFIRMIDRSFIPLRSVLLIAIHIWLVKTCRPPRSTDDNGNFGCVSCLRDTRRIMEIARSHLLTSPRAFLTMWHPKMTPRYVWHTEIHTYTRVRIQVLKEGSIESVNRFTEYAERQFNRVRSMFLRTKQPYKM